MPTSGRIFRLLGPLVLVVGCGEKATGGSTGGEITSESTSSGATSTASATTSSGGDGDGSPTDSSSSSAGEPVPTFEEFEALCSQQLHHKACLDVAAADVGGSIYFCSWQVDVGVVLASDACQFDRPTSHCLAESASHDLGCYGGADACNGPDTLSSASVSEDGAVLSARYSGCRPALLEQCQVTADGVVESGPAECTCLCDRAFPGV